MPPSANPRKLAVELIAGVVDGEHSLSEIQEQHAARSDMDPRDQAFARHLAYGVLRWLSALDWLAAQLMQRPLKRKDRDVHRLILVGLFELWQDGPAEHAAVNETAECARRVGKPWAVGLINAVLRRFQREKADWLAQLDQRPERYAHPEWLVNQIRADWPDHWREILDANNRQAGLWLRVNRARTTAEDVTTALAEAGFEFQRHQHAQDAIQVVPPAPVESLPGFADGLWSVQDPAAQLAAGWVDAQTGQRVLDACAAPGGKTFHILETSPEARVCALDRSDSRLQRLRQNARRLGFAESEQLTVIRGDALDPPSWWDGTPFDRILLDAPCTATGVIRRHPEIKWLRTAEQVEEAVAIQAAMLRSLWPLLKAGGMLVYATCSVLRNENSRQIRQFIESHSDARVVPRDVAHGLPCEYGRQVLPGEADMDGFYYARIRKLP